MFSRLPSSIPKPSGSMSSAPFNSHLARFGWIRRSAACWGSYRSGSGTTVDSNAAAIIPGGYIFSQITTDYYTTLGLLTNVGSTH